MDAPRPTQKDIADRLGIHRSTVSLVFKNHPGIAEKTKQRVLKAAASLGYTPDPMLAALAAYRHRQRQASFRGTLAWLVNGQPEFEWRQNQHYGKYFAGAKERARHHGYQVDVMDLNIRGMNPNRLGGIMRARNISGILVCPQPPDQRELVFPWEHFSHVTFGHSLASPRLHMVTAAHSHAVRRCVLALRERGFRRIGLAIARGDDSRVDDAYLSAYLAREYLTHDGVPVPPFLGEYNTWSAGGAMQKWLREYRPDAIVTNNFRILSILRAFGLRAPQEIGVLCASMPAADSELAGIVEDSHHIGEVAVDFLVGLIQHGIRGVPEQPQRIHVEGLWHPGASVPSGKSANSPA